MSGAGKRGKRSTVPAAGRTRARDLASSSFVTVTVPRGVPSGLPVFIGGEPTDLKTNETGHCTPGSHDFSVVYAGSVWEALGSMRCGRNPANSHYGTAGPHGRDQRLFRHHARDGCPHLPGQGRPACRRADHRVCPWHRQQAAALRASLPMGHGTLWSRNGRPFAYGLLGRPRPLSASRRRHLRRRRSHHTGRRPGQHGRHHGAYAADQGPGRPGKREAEDDRPSSMRDQDDENAPP